MDELLSEFLTETAESLEVIDAELVKFEAHPDDRAVLDHIFRRLHTIKGTCGFLDLPRLEAVAHAGETLLDRFRSGEKVATPAAVTLVLEAVDRIKALTAHVGAEHAEPPGDDGELIARLEAVAADAAPARGGDGAGRREPSTGAPLVRVDADVLEGLMETVSELALTRNELMQTVRRLGDPALEGLLERLSIITAELQDGVTKARLQPIGAAWRSLPRIVRDCSLETGKSIDLVMEGEDTELDRQALELIKDPLAHMVRNACDHGVEPPEARKTAGKPETGVVTLRAVRDGDVVVIEVSDDGAGLDTEAIKRKAVETGLVAAAEAEWMTDAQIHGLIFAPGFSTARRVTNLSGRGVGMDVARANIEQIGGAVDVASEAGRGVTFTITLPSAPSLGSAAPDTTSAIG